MSSERGLNSDATASRKPSLSPLAKPKSPSTTVRYCHASSLSTGLPSAPSVAAAALRAAIAPAQVSLSSFAARSLGPFATRLLSPPTSGNSFFATRATVSLVYTFSLSTWGTPPSGTFKTVKRISSTLPIDLLTAFLEAPMGYLTLVRSIASTSGFSSVGSDTARAAASLTAPSSAAVASSCAKALSPAAITDIIMHRQSITLSAFLNVFIYSVLLSFCKNIIDIVILCFFLSPPLQQFILYR